MPLNSPVAGLRGTGDFGADERPKNFRELILWYNPAGNAPIFALSSRAGKKSVDDPEFSWWSEPNTNVRLQLASEHTAVATTITVDSVDPSAAAAGIVYGKATHLKPGDVLQAETAGALAQAYAPELLRVENVISETQFTVTRGFAGTTPVVLANDLFLTLIGSAYAEGTPAPRAVARNPIKYFNLTQIFKDTYEITGTADKTRFRTGQPWSNDKKRKTFDHARAIEWSMLFGVRSESVGVNGKPLRTMGGLRTFIPPERTTIFSDPITPNSFLDATYKVFDFDTPAGDSRIIFCGNGALNAFNKAIQADSAGNIQFTGPVKVYGMQMMEFVIPQGRFYLKTHPLMNQHGAYTNSMFVMDFAAFKYTHLKERDTKPHDDVQNKDEDVRRGFYLTEASIMVDYGGLTMAYLGNVLPPVEGEEE